MMKGGHEQTNQLHDINWGALDHLYICMYAQDCTCTRTLRQDKTSIQQYGL